LDLELVIIFMHISSSFIYVALEGCIWISYVCNLFSFIFNRLHMQHMICFLCP